MARTNLYGDEHRRLAGLLRTVREERGIRQVDLAQALQRPQSFVSKVEAGQRRVDLVELAQFCRALGVSLVEFVTRYDREGSKKPGRTRKSS